MEITEIGREFLLYSRINSAILVIIWGFLAWVCATAGMKTNDTEAAIIAYLFFLAFVGLALYFSLNLIETVVAPKNFLLDGPSSRIEHFFKDGK